MIAIRKATLKDLDRLAPLFDEYRQFYRQRSDAVAARAYLRERFSHSESIIFIASRDSVAIGFTQLYPSFSSISLGRISSRWKPPGTILQPRPCTRVVVG